MKTPKAQGKIFHHYQRVYEELGRKVARATQDEAESGLKWAYFLNTTLDEVNAWLRANEWGEVRINSPYDCTGQFFARSPYVEQIGNRILVKQSWGYDV